MLIVFTTLYKCCFNYFLLDGIRVKDSKGKAVAYMRKRKKPAVIRFPNFKRGEDKYFRSKLTLFVPWRNEQTDLYGNFATYDEHYSAKKVTIHENENRLSVYVNKLEEYCAKWMG